MYLNHLVKQKDDKYKDMIEYLSNNLS